MYLKFENCQYILYLSKMLISKTFTWRIFWEFGAKDSLNRQFRNFFNPIRIRFFGVLQNYMLNKQRLSWLPNDIITKWTLISRLIWIWFCVMLENGQKNFLIINPVLCFRSSWCFMAINWNLSGSVCIVSHHFHLRISKKLNGIQRYYLNGLDLETVYTLM